MTASSISKRLIAALALSLLWAPALARTLPLPDSLVGLNSDAGARMLLEAPARQSYWDLSIQFVTQKTQSFCGVASTVMVLNALGVPAPSTPAYEPYRVYTQDNVLDARTEAVLPQAVIARQGMTLDQLGALLQVFGVRVEVHHAADTSLDEFRADATHALAAKDRYVIVNYLRRAMGRSAAGTSRRSLPTTRRPTAFSSSTSPATNIRPSGSRHPTCSSR
jgi:hypothetical protein